MLGPSCHRQLIVEKPDVDIVATCGLDTWTGKPQNSHLPLFPCIFQFLKLALDCGVVACDKKSLPWKPHVPTTFAFSSMMKTQESNVDTKYAELSHTQAGILMLLSQTTMQRDQK